MTKFNEVSSIDGLYCKVDKKVYKIVHIATSYDEACDYCSAHAGCGTVGQKKVGVSGSESCFVAISDGMGLENLKEDVAIINKTPSIDGLYCKVMGVIYEVAHISTSVYEANNYCETHFGCCVVGKKGSNISGSELIFVARNKDAKPEELIATDSSSTPSIKPVFAEGVYGRPKYNIGQVVKTSLELESKNGSFTLLREVLCVVHGITGTRGSCTYKLRVIDSVGGGMALVSDVEEEDISPVSEGDPGVESLLKEKGWL